MSSGLVGIDPRSIRCCCDPPHGRVYLGGVLLQSVILAAVGGGAVDGLLALCVLPACAGWGDAAARRVYGRVCAGGSGVVYVHVHGQVRVSAHSGGEPVCWL